MKPEHLAEEIRDGIRRLKSRLDIPPAHDHDDLNGYMDALAEDADRLMNMIEAEKEELEKQEPAFYEDQYGNREKVFLPWMEDEVERGVEWTPYFTEPQPPAVPDEVVAFLKELAKQTPEKPDYWSSCSQCEGSINDARDLLEVLSAAPKDVE